MKIADYSLNYSSMLASGEMDLLGFLARCRRLGLEGASLHLSNLPETGATYLKRLRRGMLDQGLSLSMFTVSTDFGQPEERHAREIERAREAIRVAMFLGAPLLRVFAGSPPSEADRQNAFKRAAAGIRRVAEMGAEEGLTVALQNHNHGALCRTGEDCVRFIRLVNHPNLSFILDTGQFAGSPGASDRVPEELVGADYLESIRETASLARHVRVKFYNPRADGSEPWLDYDRIFDILRSVHYASFLDIVYEPGSEGAPGEDIRTAMPRIVSFLRSKIQFDGFSPAVRRIETGARYVIPAGGRYLEELKAETSVSFLEGPAVDRQGSVFFTDTTPHRIMQWDPQGRKLTVFREKSNAANGLLFDNEGRLLACEGAAGRVTRTDMKSGRITVLADNFEGKPLGAPNDLTQDSQGRTYFTSRLANRDPRQGNVNAVYRIDAPGRIARVLFWPNIDMPNGIVTSGDGRILYLIDADGAENRSRRIRAYELKADGTMGKEWLLYDFYPGRSGDGMCIDAEGNLYVAAGLWQRRGTSETLDTHPGIHVISPEGKLVDFIETPEDTLTNCTFGGADLRTLYITCGKRLLSVRTRIPGKPAYRPDA